jgi:hypothetical protein
LVLNHCSLGFANEMIEALDDNLVEQLLTQTVTTGRSIGTLSFTLRELKQSDEALLRRLEEKISAPRFLHLISRNGTIFELFRVIQHSTLGFAQGMIEAINDYFVDQLITQTITTGRSIGTLTWTLRELRQSDKHLLRRLEEKIGPLRFLHLITSNGTLFELFNVVQYSTLGFAAEMIEALDDKLVEKLLTKTITSGRSIGTLHQTLRHFRRTDTVLQRKLEERIGITRWWRLICAFGSIAVLVELLPSMDKSFQKQFINAAKKLSTEEWEELLRKNGFYELCYLVKNLPWFFSKNFRPDFLERILVSLIKLSNWESRNLGWANLSTAPDSVGKRYLLKVLQEQLRGSVSNALDFPSFSEAAFSISLLWRLLPSRRNEFADTLMRFIESGKPIYSDPTYLRAVRGLFSILSTPQARDTDARALLNLGNAAIVSKLCAQASTLDLFLYLWNLYALWFSWKGPEDKSFASFLNPELADSLINSFKARLRSTKKKREVEIVISLAGAMSFLGLIPNRPSEIREFVLNLPTIDEMIFDPDHQRTFLPTVFFLMGLEWVFQDAQGVPPLVWQEQLAKTGKYAEATTALENLKTLVTTRALPVRMDFARDP